MNGTSAYAFMIRDLCRVFLAIIVFATARCGDTANTDKRELMVFAAMSLKAPFDEIAALYEREHGGTLVRCAYAASGAQAEQIAHGAPADVFAPAAMAEMRVLAGKKLIDDHGVRVFAGNRMVLVSARAGLGGFIGLNSSAVRRVAVGDPRIVPAGRYGMEVLSYYGLETKLKSKIVYAHHVAQLADYAVRGEVDASLVYYSDYLSRKRNLVIVETAPPGSHSVIRYPIVSLKAAPNPAEARRFIELVLSDRGQGIMEKYGFTRGNGGTPWRE